MELYIYLPTCYKLFVETYIPYSENNMNRQINPRKAIKRKYHTAPKSNKRIVEIGKNT
jgi:hypothetical protein